MAKKYDWFKIADDEQQIDLSENGIAVIEVKGKKICITKFQEQWFGFAYKCPHAGGILANGYVDSTGNVVCPVHRYKFSLRNGRNTSGEGFYVKTFPIEKRAEGFFVGMESGGLFGIFDY
jgi:3-phenylpropionate/trans-cinnamate dioxygenase ferredoxin subunit